MGVRIRAHGLACGLGLVALVWHGLSMAACGASSGPGPVPGPEWETAVPARVGLEAKALDEFSRFVGGRGVVVRGGWMVHAWGEVTTRGDVASAVKPLYSHFLMQALRECRIASLDERVTSWEPRLADLNGDLGFKDRAITWRHLATQTSLYGLRELPGSAFAYNDWQMALFADLLFTRVYGLSWEAVDRDLLRPLLVTALGCQDEPTFLAHARGTQPGRLHISPRDFARFGLLYLRKGWWGNRRWVPESDIRRLVGSPLPAALPRAQSEAAQMLAGQRTLGSQRIPDNQTEHFASYSYLWWVNGRGQDGRLHWPAAPAGTFAALGHGGRRALVVMPEHDLVVSWNDSSIDHPAAENEAFRRLVAAVLEPVATPAAIGQPGEESAPPETPRLRVVVETDAGGDPDDEQSLVRFLLYSNEWDVEGLIANRARARDGENRNPERTGLGIVRRQLDAYAKCWPHLVRHDARYPDPDQLRRDAVAGYDDREDGVELLLRALDRPDPRPIWYSDWGSDRGSATNNLKRALDHILRERGVVEYRRLKRRLRLVSGDAFGDHTRRLDPPFVFRADSWRPELGGQRWYHRFSALTSRAGGFDLIRDVLQGHGPLGAMYPTNTTHWGKEGDTLSFLYLVPNGLNAPEHPGWGGWGGRLGLAPAIAGGAPQGAVARFYDARVEDTWAGVRHRDRTLARWAEDLQNDFRARLDACDPGLRAANRPPVVSLRVAGSAGATRATPPRLEYPEDYHGGALLRLEEGMTATLTAQDSHDPDGDRVTTTWIPYPEAGTWRGAMDAEATGTELRLTAPRMVAPETAHWLARVADSGDPVRVRYRRVVVLLVPRSQEPHPIDAAGPLGGAFQPPARHAMDLGNHRPLLSFDDGRPVVTEVDWAEKRREIRDRWEALLGPWPMVPSRPAIQFLESRDGPEYARRRIRVETGPGQTGDGWLLVPPGPGPFPAVFVPFYEPETSIGQGRAGRDFARLLTRRGFVTLSLGSPGGDARAPDTAGARCQPLAYLAAVATHAARALASLPEVDGSRLGIAGHSYGGKWALFGAAFCPEFRCAAFSDPGIVWDETRPNVNYWEPWYLGREFGEARTDGGARGGQGLPSAQNPRAGAYRLLMEGGHDLHELLSLIAPRPFLVSGGSEDPPSRWAALNHVVEVNRMLGADGRVAMTHREGHDPTEASNEAMARFFQSFLGGSGARPGP